MTINRPGAAGLTTSDPRRDTPARAATDLAHSMLSNGWSLTGAAVRVIHTAQLSDDTGLSVAVSSEAGEVRLGFSAEYRRLGDCLPCHVWHAEATRELPVEVLAAVSSANAATSDDDPTEVADELTVAGWSQPYPPERKWISPCRDREVVFIDDELDDTPLPWQIRRKAGRPVTIHATDGTPAAVIVALALTD